MLQVYTDMVCCLLITQQTDQVEAQLYFDEQKKAVPKLFKPTLQHLTQLCPSVLNGHASPLAKC